MEQVNYLKRSWAVVDLDQLDENVRLIRSMLPKDTKIAGVVKADGYGHGDIAIAREMQEQGAESGLPSPTQTRRWACGTTALSAPF